MNFPSPIKYIFCLFVLTVAATTVASYEGEQDSLDPITSKNNDSISFMWVSIKTDKNENIKKVKSTRQKNGHCKITEKIFSVNQCWHTNSRDVESFIKKEQQKFFAEEGQGQD